MEIRKLSESEFEQVKLAAKGMALDTTNLINNQFIGAFSSCGLAGFVRVKTTGKFSELATLGVIKEFRNQGVSSLMVNHLKTKYSEIHLVTVIPMHFEKLGFKKLEEVPKEMVAKFENAAYWHGYGDPVVMKWGQTQVS
tara:strand:+ start:33 stop:449 length:417 start_codon:yes stop_codon:yes gene_type:complete